MGSTISLVLTYCACTAVGSLCQACFGSTAPGTSGRKRSVLLLIMTVILSLWFQYYLGPSIIQRSGFLWKVYSAIPGFGKLMYHSWYDDCSIYDDNNNGDEDNKNNDNENNDLLLQCAGNAGVYRPTFITFVFFIIQSVATKFIPSLNKQVWPAKYGIYLLMVFISMFVPNNPTFGQVFVWIARFLGFIFLLVQQIILIDIAYNWNEDWVEKSNECDRLSYGSGQKWLNGIIGVCVSFYTLTLIGIYLLYSWFASHEGCAGVTWLITLTLLGIIAMTAIQLSGTEGSLLTSSVISLYVTYLCFTICTKNPTSHCNPTLGDNDSIGIIIGLFLTSVSLAWTGWSWSATSRLTEEGCQSTKSLAPHNNPNRTIDPSNINLDVPFLDAEDQQHHHQTTTGMVTTGGTSSSSETTSGGSSGTELWKLNLVMALISCWVAMTLTGWGTLEGNVNGTETAANPTVGRFNMIMLGISQWSVILLYIWTLVAPRLFPNRDFN